MTENSDPIDNSTNEIHVLQEEYTSLMHAMQTGVEYLKERNPTLVDPKHVRVGINSALVSYGALVKLLCDKGIIEEVEYWRALVAATRGEVEQYEKELKSYVGASVKLL